MRNPIDPAATPPHHTPARRRTFGTALVVSALLAGLLAFSPFAPARAWSEVCTNDWPGVSVQLVEGDFGLPLWLAVESGVMDGEPGHVGLCHGTGAPADNKTAGGHTYVKVVPTSDGATVRANSWSDPNAANQVNVSSQATPTYSLSTGGTSGGQALTFKVPVVVCSGPCQPGTQPADGTNGLIVGTVRQTPAPSSGTSAAYGITGLCVKVDGTTVLGSCDSGVGDAGLTMEDNCCMHLEPGTPGPCLLSVCGPSYNFIQTNDGHVMTLYVPGLTPIPVYGVHTCLYTKDANTACPG